MRVAVLATGGKDSALALHHVQSEGYEVKCLATIISKREDSWMFHFPNIRLVDSFAEAVGLPLVKAESSGIKEKELQDLEHLIEVLDVEGIVSGAIASTYQKTRIDEICKKLGLLSVTPLWQKNPLDILSEILSLRIEVIITGVYAYGLGKDWLGRKIDENTVVDLVELNRKYGVSLVGEGGEYETLTVDAPFFKKRIAIKKARRIWKEQSGYYQITQVELQNK
jgi:diphthine-ammonia ligase